MRMCGPIPGRAPEPTNEPCYGLGLLRTTCATQFAFLFYLATLRGEGRATTLTATRSEVRTDGQHAGVSPHFLHSGHVAGDASAPRWGLTAEVEG